MSTTSEFKEVSGINRTKWIKICALVLLVAALAICIEPASRSIGRLAYPKKYSDLVEQYAAQYDVPPHLVYAVIRTESSFDSQAQSGVGAIGLMQIMPDTFKWLQSKTPEKEKLDKSELYDAETNIKYGTFFLSLLREEFGSDRLAIAAYHAGRGRVNQWLDDRNVSYDGVSIDSIPSRDTGHYVDKVTNARKYYDKIYN